MNLAIISGNLTDDPKKSETGTGMTVASFSVAARRDKGKREEVDFIDCVAFGAAAEYVLEWARKGSFTEINGRWSVRKYDKKDGTKGVDNKLVVNSVFILNQGARNDLQKEEGASYSTTSTADGITDEEFPW